MARYLLAFHGGRSIDGGGIQPDEPALEAWDGWLRGLGDHVVDPGSPVGAVRTVGGDGRVLGDGGPSPLSRYAVIDVESIDEAVAAARGCPALRSGGTIEVCETFSVLP